MLACRRLIEIDDFCRIFGRKIFRINLRGMGFEIGVLEAFFQVINDILRDIWRKLTPIKLDGIGDDALLRCRCSREFLHLLYLRRCNWVRRRLDCWLSSPLLSCRRCRLRGRWCSCLLCKRRNSKYGCACSCLKNSHNLLLKWMAKQKRADSCFVRASFSVDLLIHQSLPLRGQEIQLLAQVLPRFAEADCISRCGQYVKPNRS